MKYLLLCFIFLTIVSCSNTEKIYFQNSETNKELLNSFQIINLEYTEIENLICIEKSVSNLSKLVKLSKYYEKKMELGRAKWSIADTLNRNSSFDDEYKDVRLLKDGSFEYYDTSFSKNKESTSLPEVIGNSLVSVRTLEQIYAIIPIIEPNYVIIGNENIQTSLERLNFTINILNSKLDIALDHPSITIQNY